MTKTQKAKLPVHVTLPKPPPKTQPKKESAHPIMQPGPVAALVRSAIDRIGEIARAIGPYEAFVMLMTISGLVELHYGTDPWPTVSLVGFGVIAPLIERFMQKRWP